jgi:hypothetical protein
VPDKNKAGSGPYLFLDNVAFGLDFPEPFSQVSNTFLVLTFRVFTVPAKFGTAVLTERRIPSDPFLAIRAFSPHPKHPIPP